MSQCGVQIDSQERQGWMHGLVRPRNVQQEAPTELGTLVNFTGVSGVVGRSLLYHLWSRTESGDLI